LTDGDAIGVDDDGSCGSSSLLPFPPRGHVWIVQIHTDRMAIKKKLCMPAEDSGRFNIGTTVQGW